MLVCESLVHVSRRTVCIATMRDFVADRKCEFEIPSSLNREMTLIVQRRHPFYTRISTFYARSAQISKRPFFPLLSVLCRSSHDCGNDVSFCVTTGRDHYWRDRHARRPFLTSRDVTCHDPPLLRQHASHDVGMISAARVQGERGSVRRHLL